MPATIESVSKPKGDAAERGMPPIPQPATVGSKGSASTAPSASADNFLVYGKRVEPILRAGFETVIGDDDRLRIDDTDKFPWRMVACLELYPKPPLRGPYIGTGWFVGPRTLVTAGHCVFDQVSFGGWIEEVRVVPGRHGAREPFQSVRTKRVSSIKPWIEGATPVENFDIGCVHLDVDLGKTIGWFQVAAMADGDLQGRMINISGYPVDKDFGTMQYHHANRILSAAPQRVFYDVDTYGGQSGSAVYVLDAAGDTPKAVAIHAYGTSATPADLKITANSGTRLTPELVDQIKRWIEQDGG